MRPDSVSSVRPAAVAGLFYPDDAHELAREVRKFVASGTPSDLAPMALIVPHAGYRYSGAVAGSGYRTLGNLERPVRRVYLLGPAHRVATRGVAVPSQRAFATPLGTVEVDQREIAELRNRFDFIVVSDASHAEEHSLEVHLPFLEAALDDFSLVPMVAGDIEPVRLKSLIDYILDQPDALLVVSSDLSHYHAYDEARLIDAQTIALMEQLQWKELRPETACGFIPVAALLISAAERGYRVSALDVRNSGDTAGPRDRVVGYASLVVHENRREFDGRTREELLDLAHDSIDHQLDDRTLPVDPRAWPAHCRRLAATFVTLERDGRLRGCIGSLEAEEPLVNNIANNAARAAFSDPRFAPLDRSELAELDLSISVLSPAVPIHFTSEEDLTAQLLPGRDGLILSHGRHRGTFLPSVWESLGSPRAFLRSLKRKAGLPEDYWSTGIRVERYTTESFGRGAGRG